MAKLCKQKGFSLIEVLLAIGTLAVGVLFVAGVFPVGVHLTTIAAERTIAAIAADEAFAKIKLYAKGELNDPSDDINIDQLKDDELRDFNDPNVFRAIQNIDPDEFTYPSTGTGILQKHYYWTALCRHIKGRLVQVTVFVCRKVGPNLKYRDRDTNGELREVAYPVPIKVEVLKVVGRDNELEIEDPYPTDGVKEETFINDGYTIVDNETGQIYRVLERYASDDDTILLDRKWKGGATAFVWVVPPPVGGGRRPCIGVYQKVIRF